jgi:hypothetical protein
LATSDTQLFDFATSVFTNHGLASDYSPRYRFAGADRHLLSSLMQKAVRRGEAAIALSAGRKLLAIDPRRLWRRLRVIAFEDIGIGNLDLAIALVAASCSAKWRRQLGGDELVLERALGMAAAATKDRSTDHLWSILRHDHGPNGEAKGLARASFPALVAVVSAKHLPLSYRARAALLAAGRHPNAGMFRDLSGGDVGALMERFAGLLPAPLGAACRLYARQSSDPLPVLMACVWLGASEERAFDVAHHACDAEFVEDIPLYAFDPLHTKLGREAITLWRRCYVMRLPWSLSQMAVAVWNREAALCERVLSWPMGRALRAQAHELDLVGRGLPALEHDGLFGWIESEEPALHCARRVVWRRAQGVVAEARPLSP